MRKMFCLGLAALSMGIAVPGTMAAEKAAISLPQKMAGGETVEVYYRKGLPVSAARARAAGLKQEKMVLKAGSIRREGSKPLTCDILFEKDVPVTLRDGTVIYTDIFRPVDEAKHPAIMAANGSTMCLDGLVYRRRQLPAWKNSKRRTRPIGWRRAMSSSIPTAVGHIIRRAT